MERQIKSVRQKFSQHCHLFIGGRTDLAWRFGENFVAVRVDQTGPPEIAWGLRLVGGRYEDPRAGNSSRQTDWPFASINRPADSSRFDGLMVATSNESKVGARSWRLRSDSCGADEERNACETSTHAHVTSRRQYLLD